MWRVEPRHLRGVAVVAAITGLAMMAGAGPAKKKHVEPPPPKVDETLGDLAHINRNPGVKLEGVGLVVGLDDTGVDAPPGPYRTKIVEDMKKANIEKPNELLKSRKVSVVIVRMLVPSGVTPSDRLDVDIDLPPGCGTKSLAGGFLLQTRLRETMVLGGAQREGQEAAFAQGPVMTGSTKKPDDLRVGRVLGGGRIRKEIPFQLVLEESRKSFRTAALAEAVVNLRFPQSDGVDQKGSATAKTDQYLVLKVPKIYHQDQERFFRVVKLLPVVDTPNLRAQRLTKWGNDLLDPKTAGMAALRLEGMGVTAAETLKTALTSRNAQVRFFAAEALAYLNDTAGSDVLVDSVVNLPQFRAQALASLACNDQPAFHMCLRKLMDVADVEVRYGAFNALRTLASDDAFLGQIRVLKDTRSDDESASGTDSMALATAGTPRKPRVDDPFSLYVVESEGPPMVHVSRTRRCEVVIFGRSVKLQTPIVLGAGALQLNAADGDDAIEISKIVPSEFGDRDKKVASSLDLADVIRQTANLGATYPEIVTILQGADRQRNLPGPLVVDAVPTSKPEYVKAEILGQDVTAKKDSAVQQTKATAPAPRRRFFNLFGRTQPTTTEPRTAETTKPAAPPSTPMTPESFIAPGGPSAKTDLDVLPASATTQPPSATTPPDSPSTPPADPAPAKPRSLLDRLFRRNPSTP